jgi:hypothetical protein
MVDQRYRELRSMQNNRLYARVSVDATDQLPSAVRKVELRPEWLINSALDRVDFEDAFAIDVDRSLPQDPNWWLKLILEHPPKAVAALIGARNLAMKPFGLKSGEQTEHGESDVFTPIDSSEHELLVGTDDKHLNFRGNVVTEPHEDRLTLTFGTVVKFNNAFGRLYFLPVKPMHAHVVVPAMLRHAARVASG